MSNPDIIVVGAGIAGLTAAYTAQCAGKTVRVLEASDRPGGRIIRMTRNGDALEAGAQGIHSNYDAMFGLIEKMGLTGDLIPGGGKAQFLDRNGTPRVTSSNADMIKIVGPRGAADLALYRTRYFTLRKRMPQFEIVRYDDEYDNQTAAEALSWASPEFFDFVLRPQTHAQTGTSPEHTNLYHLVNMLRIRLATKVLGLKTGIVTLCERLAESVPVTYGAPVAKLLTTGDKVDGVLLESGATMKAQHVVVACPIGTAAKIVPDQFAPAKSFLGAFTNTPLPLVIFFLDRPVDAQPYAFFGHAYHDVIYNMALNHTRKTPFMAPSGKAIISAWPAYPGGAEMIEKSDADIIARALSDLEPMFPGIAEQVEEARVMRHSWGFARYEPGSHRRLLDFKAYASKLKGVSFAGNDYDGVHMESAVRNGQRAAERAAAE